MMIKKQLLKFSIVGILLPVLLSGCGRNEEISIAKTDEIRVEIMEASTSNAISTNQLNGTVKSETRSEIGTKVFGEIEAIQFKIGETVRRGQVLIQIKDDDLQAKKAQIESGLEEVNANFDLVGKDYNRYKILFEQESATLREWEEIQTAFATAKARKKAAQNQLREIEDLLNYTTIKAPYSGVIAARYADEGDIASPGKPLIVMEKEQAFEVDVTVPESSISYINIGDTMAVSIPSTGAMLEGVVAEISSSAEPMSRQFKAVLLLNIGEYEVRSGMYAEVNIQKEGRPTIFIPKTSLVERGQLVGVYAVSTNNNAVLRWLTPGVEQGDMIEILSGLKDGENFVRNASDIKFDGQKVSRLN